MMSVSGMMFSEISPSIFLFIKYNETPAVKSSNIILSFIQLTGQLLTVLIMPFLFIGEVNTMMCILRPVCIGILLTVTTGVTMIKIRTLLRIFQKPIPMTKKERVRAKYTEIFFLVLLVIIDASVLSISCVYKNPSEVDFTSDEEKYHKRHCNTDIHIIAQFGFLFLLLLFNSVQAIRARHLPENFKETRIIILASVLQCVIVGNVLWSYSFQKNYYWKSIFLFYATFLCNAINFTILYAYKVYIILFVPHLNTRKHFNSCMMRNMKKQQQQQQQQQQQSTSETVL